MKILYQRSLLTVALFCSLISVLPALAQGSVPESDAAPAESGSDSDGKADKSGTNPTNIQNEFRISNDYQDLDGSRYSNTTKFIYNYAPVGNLGLKVTLPLRATDTPTNPITRSPDREFGLGDVKFKVTNIPYVDKKIGVVLGSEFEFDTAGEANLGRGRYTAGPLGGVAFFLPGQMIFAPVYQHVFDLGGDDDRREISEGYLDLYVVKALPKQKMWLIFDPTITFDYENDNEVNCTFDLEIGKMIRKAFGGVASVYARPSLGVGKSRPYEWSVETGIKVVGF